MWRFLWPVFGGASLILAVINIVVSLKGKRTAALKLLVISLVLGLLTMLSEYALIAYWVGKSDWAALADVVPGMFKILTAAVLVLEALNVAAAMILIKRRK